MVPRSETLIFAYRFVTVDDRLAGYQVKKRITNVAAHPLYLKLPQGSDRILCHL
jgi:hypothetical protein